MISMLVFIKQLPIWLRTLVIGEISVAIGAYAWLLWYVTTTR